MKEILNLYWLQENQVFLLILMLLCPHHFEWIFFLSITHIIMLLGYNPPAVVEDYHSFSGVLMQLIEFYELI